MRLFRKRTIFPVGGVLVAMILGGCASQPTVHVPSDLSAPEPAAMTFLRAIAAGDARTARDAAVDSDVDRRWIEGMITFTSALRDYDDALTARFGRAARARDVDIRQSLLMLVQDPMDKIADGIVHQNEETAQIEPAVNGIPLTARPPICLRRVKGLWKVDVAATAGSDPHYSPQTAETFLTAGNALRDEANKVRRGQYRTLAEALGGTDAGIP